MMTIIDHLVNRINVPRNLHAKKETAMKESHLQSVM